MARKSYRPERRKIPCKVPGCERFAIYGPSGFCWSHWDRWRRHGSPYGGRAFRGDPERYFRETVVTFAGDGCLIWPYARSKEGYGVMRRDDSRSSALVHRMACEEVHGSAPFANAVAAHSCHGGHLGCVNPRHVAWMTQGENIAMSRAAGRM
jgi:hypothetical protein